MALRRKDGHSLAIVSVFKRIDKRVRMERESLTGRSGVTGSQIQGVVYCDAAMLKVG